MAGESGSSVFSRLAITLAAHPVGTFVGIAFGCARVRWSLVLLDLPSGTRASGGVRNGLLLAVLLGRRRRFRTPADPLQSAPSKRS